ncbi:uncharacterized protein LOC123679246 isoform X2 [Harmonia axyridis]|uniref:uncharacterized protein LOC123679246 isoform X2 n=1 Tax=Harmonia axyridis TaxID=115357 RepID=UPI001E27763C|nr:uncharacterized protein LOC123679246 isoform X2 [Harmonia axyridis]
MQSVYFKTKRVHIFVNGHPESKAFYIHPRCRLGWNAILDCFSRTLKPYFGAIRVIKTVDGRKVIEGFNDLQHEGKYVACGIEAFRPIKGGYLTSSELTKKVKTSEYYPAEFLSPDERRKYPCLIETMRKGRTIIYVFANGKRSDPKKIVLIRSDYKAWDSILKHIGIILDIPEGVKGMYTVFGQPLCSPYEVQHGGFYVAIPFGSNFKQIKYHILQRSKSYHESSPMVTKDVYISAAKHCTTLDGIQGKRIKLKPMKVKDIKEEETQDTQDENYHHVTISRSAIKRKEDVDMEENEILITNYMQKEKHTQTSGIFLEATHDEDNALILKQKKYFLVSESELEKLGDIDKSKWYLEILPDLLKEKQTEIYEENKDEIEWVAGAVVGVIINMSEKIANRSVFGDHMEELGDGKVSLIPDTLQPKRHQYDTDQPTASQNRELYSSFSSKDRSLRLSVPIGRLYSEDYYEDPNPELGDGEIQLHALDREFTPLTPVHNNEEIMYLQGVEDYSDLTRQESTLLRHLKKDSLGIYPEENSIPTEQNEIGTKHLISEKGDVEEDSEGWKKLDILEDLGIMEEEAIEEQEMEEQEMEEQEMEDEEMGTDENLGSGIFSEDHVYSDRGEESLDEEGNYSGSVLSEKDEEDVEGEDFVKDHYQNEHIETASSQQSQIEDFTKNTESIGTGSEESTIKSERQSVNEKIQSLVNIPVLNEMPTDDLESKVAGVSCSNPSSIETMSTWFNPLETILDSIFENESVVKNPITLDLGEENRGIRIESVVPSSRQRDIEEDRKSLMSFLRMKIEIALNTSLNQLKGDFAIQL